MQDQFDKRYSPRDAMLNLSAIELLAEQETAKGLAARGKAPRASTTDDKLFGQFNTSLAVAFGSGALLSSFYLDLARRIEKIVLDFEDKNATEIHKGSIYFNAAVCALVHHDFDAALYYFSAADQEDVKTSGNPTTAMFSNNPLFKKWVTQKLHAMLAREVSLVAATATHLLPNGYSSTDFDRFLGTLPVGILGSVIVVLCRYLASCAFRQLNNGTAVIRYRLVIDLCVAYEGTLKAWVRNGGGQPDNTLGKVLRHSLAVTQLGDISAFARGTGNLPPCNSLTDYDSLLNGGILPAIDQEGDRLRKAAKLICFVTHTRNQVAHDLDPSAAIFKNDQLCQDVARRVLVALCLNAHL